MAGELHPPLVSVAIRAYRRRWLSDAIGSVLAQTHRNLEVVVYDDAGDLQDVATGFNDDRIRYYRATIRFQASGRFTAAVALCRGHYIGVLDDDDRYEPEFVATLLAALERDPRVGVAFCRTAWDLNGRIFFPSDRRPPGHQPHAAVEMLTKGWTVSPSQMLIRRAALEDGERDQPVPDGVAPDVFVNVRVAVAGWQHVLVDAPLVVCRWHDDQLSRTLPGASDVAVATWQALELHDPELVALRARRLARALLVRSLDRLRLGDMAGAKTDLREAARVCPSAWRGVRRMLWLTGMLGPAGMLAAKAWASWSPAGRRRKRPPRAIGDRGLR